MATLVKFRIHPDCEDVYAYFPQIDWNRPVFGNTLKTCYVHVGQHSSCSIGYMQESKAATPEQYKDLLSELNGLGYVLKICK